MIYYIMFLLGFIIYKFANKNELFVFKYIFMSSFIFIFGLRYFIGKDYKSYYEYYYRESLSHLEKFWQLIYSFSKNNDLSPYFVFLISFMLTYLIIFYVIEKESKDKGFTFLLIGLGPFFLFSLSGIRQSLAASLFLLALALLNRGKVKTYLILILIGALIHKSLIFLLPIVFFKKVKINFKYFCILYLVSLIFVFKSESIVNIINLLLFFKGSMLNYSHYLLSSVHGLNLEKRITILSFALKIFNFSLMGYKYKSFQSDEKQLLYINISIFYLLIDNVFFHVPIIRRLCVFFYLPFAFAVSNKTFFIENRTVKVLYHFILILVMGLFFTNNIWNLRDYLLPFTVINVFKT